MQNPSEINVVAHTGDAGDDLIVPELAQYLATQGLQAAAEQAMWAIFHRSPNPSVSELMNQVDDQSSSRGYGSRFKSSIRLLSRMIPLGSRGPVETAQRLFYYHLRQWADGSV